MRHQLTNRLATALVVLWSAVHCEAAEPHLVKHGAATQLVVQGKPMLLLAGELSNSAASSAGYMAPHWPRLRAMHLNTVLAPVSWELVEPTEGHFDWHSVDDLLAGARANDLKLVLLWFGAWKNSMSTYAPAWVKRDSMRFPRAKDQTGRSLDILSAFSSATRDADKRAFTSLLAHIRAEDQERNTVLMVQVENEIGMLTAPRDLGPEASARFREPVPSELMHVLDSAKDTDSYLAGLWRNHGGRRAGDWAAVFGAGEEAAEVFSAWYYARYVESLVKAGKAAYPLPMYVNAALNRKNKRPGEYPSGGPLPHLLEVWKTAAPSLDLLAPDIYFPNFVEIATRYRRADNPLFIPEANYAGRGEFAANGLYAFGKLDAIGIAPFSVDTVDDPPSDRLSRVYRLLTELAPIILANQGLDRMSAFRPAVLEDGTVRDAPVTETIGNYRFTVSFVDTQSPPAEQAVTNHGALIARVGPEEYLIAGQGVIVTFAAADDQSASVGIESDWEGRFDDNGVWVAGRLLNGDQTHQGRHVRLAPDELQIQRVRLYRYH
jgi:beta-galactosidase GanA